MAKKTRTPSKRIKNLKALHKKAFFENNPDFPPHCYPSPKFSDKNANERTKSIVKYIQFRGGMANRINNAGVYDKRMYGGKGGYRKGSVTPGVPDIMGNMMGMGVAIEVKQDDRLSDAQKKWKAQWEAAGGLYYVARSFDGFWDWFCEKWPEDDQGV